MPIYVGVDGAMKEIKSLYAGIGGAAKEISAMYAGVDGAAKEIFSGSAVWKKYSVTGTYAPGALGEELVKPSSELTYPFACYAFPERNELWARVSTGGTARAYSDWSAFESLWTTSPYTTFARTASDMRQLVKITNVIETVANKSGNVYYSPVVGWDPVTEEIGDYIEDVTAPSGTYPDNGPYDGYWYILQS